ncbi:phage terminase small subunit P27 family [[Clostridium] colinum]|uniref:phage terminase small subunit P27 family n=1 Tax=[Clostridium] colinum TaxID=36835 RepID=UPI0020256700|nr:phage terminase small subunit P27 family [[Clostridium] colinum]
MQVKHLTKEEIEEKEEQENLIIVGREDLKKPPSWLIDNIAKKEFKRIIKNFNNLEVIGNLDINNIAGYCNAYSFYIRATREIVESGVLTIKKQLPNGSYTMVENPLIKIQKQYADEMRRFASLCGLTIDSRLKLAVQKTTKERQCIDEVFGDI